MTRKEVMDMLEEMNKVYSIQIIGNKKDKSDGFYILMNVQQFSSTKKGIYHGIKSDTLKVLEDAEIKFKVVDK